MTALGTTATGTLEPTCTGLGALTFQPGSCRPQPTVTHQSPPNPRQLMLRYFSHGAVGEARTPEVARPCAAREGAAGGCDEAL